MTEEDELIAASTSTGEVTVEPLAGAQIKTVLVVLFVQSVGGGVLPLPTENVSAFEMIVPVEVQPFTVSLCEPAVAEMLWLICGLEPPLNFKTPSR